MNTFAPTAPRQYYLDWLRIIAFAILIPYHVGMYHVSWDWHIKSSVILPALEPWMRLFSPWRMDLLFLVSGASTVCIFQRRGASLNALRDRARRLLWPLLFGMLVIVPPQSYLEVVRRFAYDAGYLDFMLLYLRGWQGFCDSAGRCLILPTWNHLWYLPYLFTYTALFWLCSALLGRQLNELARGIDRTAGMMTVLLVPIVVLMILRMLLRARYPITHALLDDWFAHSQYFAMFCFGALLAQTRALIELAHRLRWIALVAAVLAWAALVTRQVGPGSTGVGLPQMQMFVISVQQWCAIIAALGFGRRLLNFDSAARRYLNEAVYPMYIVHQTLIILFAVCLHTWALTPVVELPLLILLATAASLMCYELVRRVSGLRTAFGLGTASERTDQHRPRAVLQ